jgi:hypothetical protein
MNRRYERFQDRETINYHIARSRETWYGILTSRESQEEASRLKGILDKELARRNLHLARVRGTHIFCSGPYTPEMLTKIKEISEEAGKYDSTTIKGKYERLLGSRWAEELLECDTDHKSE